MKIEKLNENAIKVTITFEDILENNIDINNFSIESPDTEDLFFTMLKKAEDEVGVDFNGSKIMVEASSPTSDEYVMIISKLNEVFNEKHLAKTKVRRGIPIIPLIYQFCNFDFLIEGVKNICEFFEGSSKVYKYGESFYLSLFPSYTMNIPLFDAHLTEFGAKINSPILFQGALNEHCEIIIGENAVETLFNFF